MRFALVDPRTLRISIVEVGPREAFAVPLATGVRGMTDTVSLERIVYETFAGPARERHYAALARANARRRKTGRVVAHKLTLDGVPPWLMTVAVVMFQGVLQGVAWDGVKASVRAALAKVRGAGVAPKPQRKKTKTAEFHWSDVATSETRRRELYFRLQEVHKDDGFLYPLRAKEIGKEPARDRLDDGGRRVSVGYSIPKSRPSKRKKPVGRQRKAAQQRRKRS